MQYSNVHTSESKMNEWLIPRVRGSKEGNGHLEICPEIDANGIHELYDRHHKVSAMLNTY